LKFLITGGNGFLATELATFLKKNNHILYVTDRTTLDVRNSVQVEDFFSNNEVDFVLHTAVKGGNRLKSDSINDLFDNLVMFDNLAKHCDKFKLMINFGSGAEFDRSTEILNADEKEIFDCYPRDYYGLSKNLIARKILEMNTNIVNLRIFGCFGEKEKNTRLIKSTINNFRSGKEAVIHQNKLMDYFYVGDLCRVVDYCVENYSSLGFKDLNLCYKEKKTLEETVFLIKCLTSSSSDVIINNRTKGVSYTGDSSLLESLNLPLVGLERGIVEILEKYET